MTRSQTCPFLRCVFGRTEGESAGRRRRETCVSHKSKINPYILEIFLSGVTGSSRFLRPDSKSHTCCSYSAQIVQDVMISEILQLLFIPYCHRLKPVSVSNSLCLSPASGKRCLSSSIQCFCDCVPAPTSLTNFPNT